MATHDYVIDNQSATAFRSDLNSVLQAIVSTNSNATAPATPYANMLWYDTATNILKKRNEANSAWINLGTIDEAAGTFTPSGGGSIASQAEAEAGTNNTNLMTPLRTSQAIAVLGSHVNYQVFTASGTWTKPSNLSADAIVIVEAWGGGGGGSRCPIGTDRISAGGGGGAYQCREFLASSLGATVSVTVGAGGAGSTTDSTPSTAGDGGSSTFGTVLTAFAGGGGRTASPIAANGGNGGSYEVSAVSYISLGVWGGNGGSTGAVGAPGIFWGGGGGSGGNDGGNGWFGGGGGGGGQTTVQPGGTSRYGGAGGAGGVTGVGTPGSAPGGGGGGGRGNNGGAGARGEVRVWTIG